MKQYLFSCVAAVLFAAVWLSLGAYLDGPDTDQTAEAREAALMAKRAQQEFPNGCRLQKAGDTCRIIWKEAAK